VRGRVGTERGEEEMEPCLFDLGVLGWAQLGEVDPFYLLFYAHGHRHGVGAEPERVG
jgi:hypothetical protein